MSFSIRISVVACAAFILTASIAGADGHDGHGDHGGHRGHDRPDAHAPIGVMVEHMHDKGDGMLSYRFMFMDMDGNRDGTSSRSSGDVLAQFPVTPTEMTTQVHMFGAMWAPLQQVTLVAMLPLVQKSMDHTTRMGVDFTTDTFGVGDFKFAGLVRLWENDTHHFHFNAGMSFPTGSVTESDDTPGGNVQLPYPMQLGSGTYDFLPGVTYTGQVETWSWGGQANGVIRVGRNSEGYRLGDGYEITGWGARKITGWVSVSLRLDWRDWDDITGADPNLNPRMVSTADPDRRGGRRLDVGVGLNFLVPRGALAGNRFAVEALFPTYQSLSGPQLEQDWMITAGWQYAF